MKAAITMKRTSVTNPARSGYVSITSNSSDLGIYLRKVNSIRNLNVNEEKELALRAKNGDLIAKKVLVQANLKLVMTIARKAIHVSKLPLVNLIKECNLGLMIAIVIFIHECVYKIYMYLN